MLPSEKPDRILFYHYYFQGIEKPLVIEAANKEQASQFVLDHINKLPNKTGIIVVDMKITTPIFGVTESIEKGITYIWCGKKYSASGWMLKSEFEEKEIYKNDQK